MEYLTAMISRLLPVLIFCLVAVRAHAWTLTNEIEVPEEKQVSLVRMLEENRATAQKYFKNHHWGLELITAGGTFAQPESVLGHSLLRFLDDDNDPMNDLVIGFEMVPVDRFQAFTKAFNGGYEAYPMVKELSSYLRQYALSQSRSTGRLILPTTPEMILRIKELVMRMLTATDLQGDYLLHKNNCATLLLRLLGSAGYPTPWMLADVPTMMEPRLRSAMVLYAPSIRLPSVMKTIWKYVCEYMREKKGIQSCTFHWWRQKAKKWTWDFDAAKWILAEDEFWKFLGEKASPIDKGILVNFWPDDYISSGMRTAKRGDLYVKLLEFHAEHRNELQPWGPRAYIPALPRELYSLCATTDKDCREKRLQAALKLWPRDQLQKLTDRFAQVRDSELRRAVHLTEPGQQAIAAWLSSAPVLDMIEFSEELRRPSPKHQGESPVTQ